MSLLRAHCYMYVRDYELGSVHIYAKLSCRILIIIFNDAVREIFSETKYLEKRTSVTCRR